MTSRAWRSEMTMLLLRISMIAMMAMLLLTQTGQASAAGRLPPQPLLPAPSDLDADGAQASARGVPVVILFSLPGCSYCDVVRQNYLAPILRDLPENRRPLIREVQINGSAVFVGFGGERITHAAFAQRHGVRFAPTVVLLDRAGNLLTSPVVGGDTTGLYGGVLDNAFGEAGRRLALGRRAETSGD